jgi:hypothetical protein
MQPEGATSADVGLVRTKEAEWLGSALSAGHSNASKWGRLFSLRNLNQNEEIFQDISLPVNQWDRAYVFHDPSFAWFLVFLSCTTKLKQSSRSRSAFLLHP